MSVEQRIKLQMNKLFFFGWGCGGIINVILQIGQNSLIYSVGMICVFAYTSLFGYKWLLERHEIVKNEVKVWNWNSIITFS